MDNDNYDENINVSTADVSPFLLISCQLDECIKAKEVRDKTEIFYFRRNNGQNNEFVQSQKSFKWEKLGPRTSCEIKTKRIQSVD